MRSPSHGVVARDDPRFKALLRLLENLLHHMGGRCDKPIPVATSSLRGPRRHNRVTESLSSYHDHNPFDAIHVPRRSKLFGYFTTCLCSQFGLDSSVQHMFPALH